MRRLIVAAMVVALLSTARKHLTSAATIPTALPTATTNITWSDRTGSLPTGGFCVGGAHHPINIRTTTMFALVFTSSHHLAHLFQNWGFLLQSLCSMSAPSTLAPCLLSSVLSQ